MRAQPAGFVTTVSMSAQHLNQSQRGVNVQSPPFLIPQDQSERFKIRHLAHGEGIGCALIGNSWNTTHKKTPDEAKLIFETGKSDRMSGKDQRANHEPMILI